MWLLWCCQLLLLWFRVLMMRILHIRKWSCNLGNDHEFIIKEYSLHSCEVFRGSLKQNHKSLCSNGTILYHCGESCSFNMISKLCPPKNLVVPKDWLVNPQMSNKELQKKRSRASIKGRCWMMKVLHH